jgi:hypothetical protein
MIAPDGCSKILNKTFNLKAYGKSVCPKAFAMCCCISYETLQNCVQNLDTPNTLPDEEKQTPRMNDEPTKRERIITFLEYLKEKYSEPMVR